MALIVEASSSSIEFNNTIIEQENYDKTWTTVQSGREVVSAINTWYATGSTSAITSSLGASLSSNQKWFGGVLAPNGNIYGIPYDTGSILKITPNTNTATIFTTPELGSGTAKYAGGVLAPNGKIYCIPATTSSIMVIDPDTDTTTVFGNLGAGTKWFGGVLAPNGNIYAIPYNSGPVLKINPNTNTTSTFSSIGGGQAFTGGVLAPNRKIYCVTRDATYISVIDTNNDTTYNISLNDSSNNKWIGGVLGPDGKIYFISYGYNSFLSIDPTNDVIDKNNFIKSSTNFNYYSGCLGADGKIYCIPYTNTTTNIAQIDIKNKTITFSGFGTTIGTTANKWIGGILAPNGIIYAIPFNASSILQIDTKGTGKNYPNILLSAYLNKL